MYNGAVLICRCFAI